MKAISTAPDHKRYSRPEIINFLKGLTYSLTLTQEEVNRAQAAMDSAHPGPEWEQLAIIHRERRS